MEKIFKRAAHGNKKAQAELYNQLSPKIYNLAFYTIYSHEDAQDITQETFARLIKALKEGKVASNPVAYAYSIARNLCMDQLKQGEKMVFYSEEVLKEVNDPYLFSSPEKASLLQEQIDTTVQAALALNPSQRMALNLRELDELSYEQIGEIMGLNRNAVAALLFRARRKFKEVFRMAHIKHEGEGELCQDISMLLSSYMDDELDEESRHLVEEHLDECPLCRLSLEEMEEASVSYRSLLPLAPIALAQAGLLMRLFSFFARLLPGIAGAEQLVPGVKLLSKGAEVGYVTFRAAVAAATAVVLVSGAGGAATLTANEGLGNTSAVVHDTRSEAVVSIEDYNIYLSDLESGEAWQLTNDGLNDHPSISPDGETIAFASFRPFVDELVAGSKGVSERYTTIFIMDSDGSHRRPLTDPSMGSCRHPSFTPDGRYLVFASHKPSYQVMRDGYMTYTREVAIYLYDLEEKTISREWLHTQWSEETDVGILHPQYLADDDIFVFNYGGHQGGDFRLQKAVPGVEGFDNFWDYKYREYISPCLSPDGSLIAGIEHWSEYDYVEGENVNYVIDHAYTVLFDTQGNPQRGRSICMDPSNEDIVRSRISWMNEGMKAVYSRSAYTYIEERNILIDFETREVTPLSIEGYSLGGGRVDFTAARFGLSHQLFPEGETDLSHLLGADFTLEPEQGEIPGEVPSTPADGEKPLSSDFYLADLCEGMALSRDGKTILACYEPVLDRGQLVSPSGLVLAAFDSEGFEGARSLRDVRITGEQLPALTSPELEWWEEEGYVAIAQYNYGCHDLWVVDLNADDIQPVRRAAWGYSPSWARLPSGEKVLCYADQVGIWLCPPLQGEARCIETSTCKEAAISPDGRRLALVTFEGGRRKLILKNIDTGERRCLFESDELIHDLSWDDQGKRLLFVERSEIGYIGNILYMVDVDGGAPRAMMSCRAGWKEKPIVSPHFAGDGDLICFGAVSISGKMKVVDLVVFDPEGKRWWFLIPGYDHVRQKTHDFAIY
jgi:RNA polymerase sigma-70 factor (ECF subfamily)